MITANPSRARKPPSSAPSSPASSPLEARPYFSEAALKFLRGIERHNDREWFEPRRETFERELKQPMLRLITEVSSAMAGFSPAHLRPPQKIMMRFYRDTRFSADKSPYKTRVSAWWSREGLEKTSGAGFYMHVSAKEVTIAAGVYMPEKDQLYAIRKFLLDHHEELRMLLNDTKMRRLLSAFEGLALTRPPKGFPKDHPAMDLLLCRQWGVAAELPPQTALSPAFAKEVVKRFALAAPLVAALNQPLVRPIPSNRNTLFPMPGEAFRKPR
jgi:uncharacterized protein (TIGR02453 family)